MLKKRRRISRRHLSRLGRTRSARTPRHPPHARAPVDNRSSPCSHSSLRGRSGPRGRSGLCRPDTAHEAHPGQDCRSGKAHAGQDLHAEWRGGGFQGPLQVVARHAWRPRRLDAPLLGVGDHLRRAHGRDDRPLQPQARASAQGPESLVPTAAGDEDSAVARRPALRSCVAGASSQEVARQSPGRFGCPC